jgi:beta-lactamase regulating signal transducer with metallopeptidase domain
MAEFKKVLSPVVGTVALLLGLFGGVLTRIAPPDTTGLAIAVGVVSFLLLLFFLLLSALSRQVSTAKSMKIWLMTGIALTLLSVPAVFVYPTMLDRYTYVPEGNASARKIHAADEFLTLEAKSYIEANPGDASPARLARNFESDDMIWQKRGLEIAQQRLLMCYAWLVISLCSAIFCFVQMIGGRVRNSSSGKSKRARTLAGSH